LNTAAPEMTEDWFSDETATFGDRLAGAREIAGLSQEGLATKLGVKLSSLKDWENDLAEPRANRLCMMSGVLNVSIRWLLTGEGVGPVAPLDLPDGQAEVRKVIEDISSMRREAEQALDRIAALEVRLRHLADKG